MTSTSIKAGFDELLISSFGCKLSRAQLGKWVVSHVLPPPEVVNSGHTAPKPATVGTQASMNEGSPGYSKPAHAWARAGLAAIRSLLGEDGELSFAVRGSNTPSSAKLKSLRSEAAEMNLKRYD